MLSRGKLQAPPSNVRTDSADRASATSRAMVARQVEKKKVKGGGKSPTIILRSDAWCAKPDLDREGNLGASEYSPTGETEQVGMRTEADH
jgi:hypothetical protein